MSKSICILVSAFLWVLWLYPPEMAALDPNTPADKYIHHTWTTREGLPQNTIHSIVQDSSGCLWLGTDRGLARFDGTVFKVLHKGIIPALKNNSITSLLISKNGDLWIATYGGGITRFSQGVFKNYSLKEGLTNHFINAIAEDNNETLWLATTGDGVIRFKDNKFTALNDSRGLSYNIVSCLFADSNGKLWAGTEKGLNCIYNDRITIYTGLNGLPGDNIQAIFEDRKGYLWVGTDNGVGFIRNRPKELERGSFTILTKATGLTDHCVRYITEDKAGNIWLATQGGLNRVNADSRKNTGTGSLSLRIDHFTSGEGLSDDVVLCLYEDRWGNFWAGTSAGGLNVMRDGTFEFYTEKDGLTGNYILAIYEDNDKTVWIGTGGGGLNCYKDGKFASYTQKDGLSSNTIESLIGDRAGNLWIGTNNGLNRFNNGKFQVITPRGGLSDRSIKSLLVDSKDNLWIGTFGSGLDRYRDGRFENFDTGKGLSDNFVLTLGEDTYGNIWIGTNRGINCYDGRFFRYFSGQEEMPRGRVLDIYCDPKGVLWIATQDEGLIRYARGTFTRLKDAGEFSDRVIYRVLEDYRQNLWFGTDKGIFSASRGRLNWNLDGRGGFIDWRHYQEGNGLKTSVCSGGFQPAGWKTSNQTLWFPTPKGIAVMDPRPPGFTIKAPAGGWQFPEELAVLGPGDSKKESIPHLTVVRELPVKIQRVTADNVTYDPGAPFKLPAKTGKIEFYYTAIGYSSPGDIVFKYRLMGFDGKWIRSTRQKSAAYLDLPPGAYEFKVAARRSDGNWADNGDSCYFIVKSPVYQTFWFYFLLTLALVSAAFGIPRLMEIIAKNRKIQLEKYKGSSLTPRKSKSLLNRLLKIMAEEKPYLDPDLSLQKLAEQMGITKEDLSRVINEQLDRNFKNFVNEYRIEAAKLKLLDPRENKFVLLKIAFDVGFNSKSVFNESFKKYTGMSPSEYRERHGQS